MLKYAESNGQRAVNGLDMFIYQGIFAFEKFVSENIDKEYYFKKLKIYLENQLRG